MSPRINYMNLWSRNRARQGAQFPVSARLGWDTRGDFQAIKTIANDALGGRPVGLKSEL